MRVKINKYYIIVASSISKISKVNAASEEIACGLSVLSEDCCYEFWYDSDELSLIQAKQDLDKRFNLVLVEGYLDMSDLQFEFTDLNVD